MSLRDYLLDKTCLSKNRDLWLDAKKQSADLESVSACARDTGGGGDPSQALMQCRACTPCPILKAGTKQEMLVLSGEEEGCKDAMEGI